MDYLYVQFGLVLPPAFDPAESEYLVEVESDLGPVFSGTLLAGDIAKKGHRWIFRDRGARKGTGVRDGIGWATLSRNNDNVWRWQVKAFAALPGAISPEINVRLTVDGVVMYDRLETWRQRSNGFVFDLGRD